LHAPGVQAQDSPQLQLASPQWALTSSMEEIMMKVDVREVVCL